MVKTLEFEDEDILVLVIFAILSFTLNQSEGAFVLSTIWAWECPTRREDMVCIWPGSTRAKERGSDRMIELIRTANSRMSE